VAPTYNLSVAEFRRLVQAGVKPSPATHSRSVAGGKAPLAARRAARTLGPMTAPVPALLLADVAERFRLLGDPVRLRLLNELMARDEAAVHDLAEATDQSHQNTSKHLRKLADAGLVASRRAGVEAVYHVADPSLPALCLLVCGSVRDRRS